MARKAVLVQVDGVLWDQAKTRAEALGIGVSQLNEDALRAYLGAAAAPEITQAVQRLNDAVHGVSLAVASNYVSSTPTAGGEMLDVTNLLRSSTPRRKK